MPEDDSNEPLYQRALSAALGELQILTRQIDQLQVDLDRLERQKAAVEAICQAIGQWIEARDAEGEPAEEATVGLTEEEISLIAYPAKMPG